MIGASGGKSIVFLKNVNTAKELNSYSFVIGGGVNTLKVFNIGGELLYDENKKFISILYSPSIYSSRKTGCGPNVWETGMSSIRLILT